MPSTVEFDTQSAHIHTTMQIRSRTGSEVSFIAIVDTGAPYTELSDRSLARAGYAFAQADITTQDLQETQKYAKVRLLDTVTLGQQLDNWIVYVSRFDDRWGIDALIGLDFFRRFRTTIDYQHGVIITEHLP